MNMLDLISSIEILIFLSLKTMFGSIKNKFDLSLILRPPYITNLDSVLSRNGAREGLAWTMHACPLPNVFESIR
jgi:hypothetical protein